MIIQNDVPVIRKIGIDNCCGCENCSNVCPKNIIEMQESEDGFLYPVLNDKDSCVKCNLCVNHCPVVSSESNHLINRCYAGYWKNKDDVLTCSSGGIWTCFAKTFTELYSDNCLICGVAWDQNYKSVSHQFASTIKEIDKFKKSKYIQSKKNDVFVKIKYALRDNKYVLFSGTPCECAALQVFLKNMNTEKLVLVDVICHGPTSPMVQREYIKALENQSKKHIIDFCMRYKKDGKPNPYYIRMIDADNREYYTTFIGTVLGDTFSVMQRKSCYNCNFKGNYRKSDITIGDFQKPDINEEYYYTGGTSSIIINTQKGSEFFEHCKSDLVIKEQPYVRIAEDNKRLETPWEESPKREKLIKQMKKYGFIKGATLTYTTPLKAFIGTFLPRSVFEKKEFNKFSKN